MSYRRFDAMITTSTLVMFVLTYLNTYEADLIRFSETRAYMASARFGWSGAIDDVSYRRAMILDPSIAIMTSRRAHPASGPPAQPSAY